MCFSLFSYQNNFSHRIQKISVSLSEFCKFRGKNTGHHTHISAIQTEVTDNLYKGYRQFAKKFAIT